MSAAAAADVTDDDDGSVGCAMSIEWGPTYCRAAVWDAGQPVVVPTTKGARFLPTCVAFVPRESDEVDEVLLGENALNAAALYPTRTVLDIHALLGSRWEDPAVQRVITRTPLKIIKDTGGTRPIVCIKNSARAAAERYYRPEQLAAFVLKELHSLAEVFTGRRVTTTMIAVPCGFTLEQRSAVHDAAAIAQLPDVRLISHASAAVVASGLYDLPRRLQDDIQSLTVCVGDSAIEAAVSVLDDAILEIKVIEGLGHMWQADFVGRLVDCVMDTLRRDTAIDMAADIEPGVMLRLRRECLRGWAKAQLADPDEDIVFDCGVSLPPVTFSVRKILDEFAADIMATVTAVTKSALKKTADLRTATGKGLGHVFIVGSAATCDATLAAVSKALGDNDEQATAFVRPCTSLTPSEAVVLGAASHAAIVDRTCIHHMCRSMRDVLLLDVAGCTIRIVLGDRDSDATILLIARNETIPSKVKRVVTTVFDQQRSITVTVVEGESPVVANCTNVATVTVPDLDPMPRGMARVDVECALESTGVLKVTACNNAMGWAPRRFYATAGQGEMPRGDIDLMAAEMPRRTRLHCFELNLSTVD